MKTRACLILMLAFVAASPAAENSGQDSRLQGLFPAFDTNRDGFLDHAEIDHVPAFLRRLDKNGDGNISQREVFHEAGHFRLRTPRLSAVLFGLLDPNEDATLDKAELDRAPEALRQLDKNGDRRISPEEVTGKQAP